MKKIVASLIFTCIFFSYSYSQNYTDKQNMPVSTNQEPFYPRGEKEFYEFVNKNIKFSEEAKKANLSGDVSVSFDVKADSSIVNFMVVSGIGMGVDEELKRVIEKVKFSPAIQNGFKVKMNMMMTLPIKAN
jgi:TonB family protein